MSMEFYDVLKNRKSIRAYQPDPVPEEALLRIAEAVNLAPTACNRQPFRLLLVKNAELRAEIASVYPQKWLKEAPVIAVMLSDSSQAWKRLEGDTIADVDAAIAMEHFILAAAAEGLGSCWICAFQREVMARVLKLSAPWRVFALSPLGYAAEGGRERVRKDLNKVCRMVD